MKWLLNPRVLAIATVTALAGGLLYVSGGDKSNNTVTAQFASAAPLVEGNQVKLDGVVVGKVTKLEVRNKLAEVTMDLDAAVLPVYRDAKFTIRPVSLLGERYIDLERGNPKSKALPSGSTVGVKQTATNVGMDEVLNTFDDPTGQGLAMLLTTLGEGVRGNGENANAAIEQLAPSMQNTDKMARVLSEQNVLIGNLVEQLEPVASAIATEEGKALDRVVAASDRLLLAAAQQQRNLDASLNELPDTVASLRRTLARLSRTADETAPTLRRLRPLTDDLPEIAAELETMADSLDPALASSEPVLKRARKLIKEAAPTAKSLRRAGPGLAKTTDASVPLVDELTRNRENVFNYIRYWALATNGRDGLSHYFRVNATVNPDTITGLLPVSSDKPARRSAKAPKGRSAQPTPTPKDLSDKIDGLFGGKPLLLPPVGSRSSKSGKPSPTGLNSKQESDLFGFMLGGD